MGKAVAEIAGLGLYAGASTYSFGAGHYDWYVIKTDFDGDTLWARTFGNEREDALFDIIVNEAGDCVAVGSCKPFSNQPYHSCIRLIDGQGSEIWIMTHHVQPWQQGDGTYTTSMCQGADGGYLIAGQGNQNAFLFKTDEQGVILDVSEQAWTGATLRVFPNPANGPVTIDCHLSSLSRIKMELFDLAGRLVAEYLIEPSGRMTMDTHGLANGVYLLNIRDKQHVEKSMKLVVNNN